MEPMVSICCAAYNHAPYIAEALESFLARALTAAAGLGATAVQAEGEEDG